MSINNNDRQDILKLLDKCIKIGYSGVTSIEYDALRVVRDYIKMFYERDLKS